MLDDRFCIRDVLTLDPTPSSHQERRDILVQGGRIQAVAATVGRGRMHGPPTRIIDGQNRLLIPGFVNAHTHSPTNILKGTGDVLSHPAFMWTNQADTASRTPDEVRLSALLGCI